jgi:hypothetical protein
MWCGPPLSLAALVLGWSLVLQPTVVVTSVPVCDAAHTAVRTWKYRDRIMIMRITLTAILGNIVEDNQANLLLAVGKTQCSVV